MRAALSFPLNFCPLPLYFCLLMRHRAGAGVEVLGDLFDAAGGGDALARVEGAAAYLVPLVARDAAEGFDDARVELDAGVGVEFGERLVVGAAGAVDAVARDGVEGVGDGEDARVQVYLVALEAERVAAAVPLLVVLRDDPGRAFEELYP